MPTSLLGPQSAMAPRWRFNDAARRRAISLFVSTRKEELLKELPRKFLSDRNTRHKEILRLGRARFAAEPEEVQTRFLEEALSSERGPESAESRSAGVVQPVQSCQGEHEAAESRCVGVANSDDAVLPAGSALGCGGGVPVCRSDKVARTPLVAGRKSPATLPPAPTKAASSAPSPPARLDEQTSHKQVRKAIMAEFAFLQKSFPGPRVFDVLAAALRLLETLGDDMRAETIRVKVAICLGIGAKLAAVSPSHTLDIWKRFTTPKMTPYMKSVEVRIVAAWARKGL